MAPPAILDGGELPDPAVRNLSEALVRAADSGTGGICYLSIDGTDHVQSYAHLLRDAARILGGLRERGLAPGDRVVLQIANPPDLLAAFWACQLGGFLPVPVTPGHTEAERSNATRLLGEVWLAFGNPAVLADPGAGRPAVPDGAAWAASWLGTVEALRAPAPAGDWQPGGWDDPAVLLLTSGSTGVPKAVVLSHGNILSRSAGTAAVHGLTPAARTFNWMPLDHVGGLVMFHLRDVYLACHQVHAPMPWVMADPLRWLEGMSRYRSGITWAPNFAFGLIVDRAAELPGRDWDLSNLGYIMNGGEPVKPRVARRFLNLLARYGLPPTAMWPGWGMSETSAGVVDCCFSMTDSSDDDRYVPVGVPHPGVTLRIVDEHDDVVPVDTVGRLQAHGEPITRGYHLNPEQNRRSFTADGWFRTGDLAFLHDGALVVTGRDDDVIVVGGESYHGHEIESAVEEFGFVEPSYTVACVVGQEAGGTDELAVFYHLRGGTDGAEAARLIRDRVTERFGVPVAHVARVAKEDVPKTGIGKLRRAQLRRWFESERGAGAHQGPPV